jgi:hypothetical protein
MGRTVRRVPNHWQHPRDSQGHYIPLHERFTYNVEEVEEGLKDGWLSGEPPTYNVECMPEWPEEERTHWQMYEDTTEGTPISPVCDSPESLARWLTDHEASFFADMTTDYEHWLRICRGEAIGLPMFRMAKRT